MVYHIQLFRNFKSKLNVFSHLIIFIVESFLFMDWGYYIKIITKEYIILYSI